MILKNSSTSQKSQKIVAVLKLAILASILIGIPAYLFTFKQDILDDFKNIEQIETFLIRYEKESVFIYIGIQIVQIIICFIPGQAVQIAAGYVYGFLLGYLYSIIGTIIGTISTFYISKILGRPALNIFFDHEKLDKYIARMNSKKAIGIVFIIFLIPGLPKDLFTYAAGVSDMKLKTFLIVSVIARTPAMMISLGLGRLLERMF